MRTYYIVEHEETYGTMWRAHKRGILSTFGLYNIMNMVIPASSSRSAEVCEYYLRKHVGKPAPKVVRVVKV